MFLHEPGAGTARCVQEWGNFRDVLFLPRGGEASCFGVFEHLDDVGVPHKPSANAAWCVAKVKETKAYGLLSLR